MDARSRQIPVLPEFAATQPAAPMVLLPYQQRWIADNSQVKICEKSRRVGLSWAEAADDTLYAASISGDDVWYIGYNLEMAREFINDCGDWAREYNKIASEVEECVLVDEDKEILALRINFPSGHRITALSSRPTNLRGKQGRVVIDEAAFHENLDGLIKAAMALLMWGGQVRIISTHDGDANPFNELVQEIHAGKVPYSLHRITLDDALAEGLYQRICLKLGREWSQEAEDKWRADLVAFYKEHADEELFCIPSQGKGTYLSRLVIERCMKQDIPVLRWACTNEFTVMPDHIRQAEARDWCKEHLEPLLAKLDPAQNHCFGEDFARSGDLTVIFPLAEQQKLHWRAPFVVELKNVPFKEQELILFYIIDRLPRFFGGCMDARGNGQYLAEVALQKYGERIKCIMLSETWYRENMPRFKSFFEDGTLEVPADADHMDDYRAVKMTKGIAKVPETHTQGKDGNQRHGDAAIALALAVSATLLEVVIYAYHPVNAKEAKDLDRPIHCTAGFKCTTGVW
jgi:phage FluMu gp28-like protein